MNKSEFIHAAVIAALQALISNNPGISCKYAAKKAHDYAQALADLQYKDDELPYRENVV